VLKPVIDAAKVSAATDRSTPGRRALGVSVEQIQPDLIIPTGKRKGQNPSVASVYRALAEHAGREAYPEAVEAAHVDFAALQQRDLTSCSVQVEDTKATASAKCGTASTQGLVIRSGSHTVPASASAHPRSQPADARIGRTSQEAERGRGVI